MADVQDIADRLATDVSRNTRAYRVAWLSPGPDDAVAISYLGGPDRLSGAIRARELDALFPGLAGGAEMESIAMPDHRRFEALQGSRLPDGRTEVHVVRRRRWYDPALVMGAFVGLATLLTAVLAVCAASTVAVTLATAWLSATVIPDGHPYVSDAATGACLVAGLCAGYLTFGRLLPSLVQRTRP